MGERVVLVTGATGAVGPSVVHAFHEAGYAIRTLSVNAPNGNLLPRDTDIRIGDVCDSPTVRAAVAGVEVVVHLAALLHQFEDSADLGSRYERVNVGGTENVVRAAVAEGVRRIVFLSTVAVYGASSGQVIDERTPPRPDTTYGRTKLAAEQAVLAATAGSKPIGTVLRAAAVYGSRVKGNYRRLAVALARHRFLQLGPCLNRRTLVHDRDLARATVLTAEHPAAPSMVFNVSDGRVHTLADIIVAICRGAGRRPPRFHVPLAAARVAIDISERAARVTGCRPPVTRMLLDKYVEDIAVDATMIQRSLGFEPSVDLNSGWRETMAVLRAEAA